MYSQNNEEEIILNALQTITEGYFVEIGSFDPFKFSNTRRLVELGWGGVYVEPAKPCYMRFVNQYGENNERITLVNKAIGKSNGKLKFYETSDAISTSDLQWKARWENNNNVKYIETLVDVITGKFLFDTYCKRNVDFLNIDTEATNIEVLDSIPLDYLGKCKVVCIEHQSELKYIRDKFSIIGFTEIHFNGENLIFKKDE